MQTSSPIPIADQRSAAILESARRAFAEKGFDGASMQDLAREAGMSVGNFYRYFPSKAAIVEALIALDMAEMEQDFAAILSSPDPMQALRTTIAQRVTNSDCKTDGKIWAEITAAALRKPEIGAAAAQMEAGIVAHLTTVFARAACVCLVDSRARWSAHAHYIVMLVKSCAMLPPESSTSSDLTHLVMRTINRTLDEIITSAAPIIDPSVAAKG